MTRAEALSRLAWLKSQLSNDGYGFPAAQLGEVIEHFEARSDNPNPPENSVRVRIAVAVDRDSNHFAYAVAGGRDSEAMTEVLFHLVYGEIIASAFVEADIPRIPTVQAEQWRPPNHDHPENPRHGTLPRKG